MIIKAKTNLKKTPPGPHPWIPSEESSVLTAFYYNCRSNGKDLLSGHFSNLNNFIFHRYKGRLARKRISQRKDSPDHHATYNHSLKLKLVCYLQIKLLKFKWLISVTSTIQTFSKRCDFKRIVHRETHILKVYFCIKCLPPTGFA